jgi:hypothetical protein
MTKEQKTSSTSGVGAIGSMFFEFFFNILMYDLHRRTTRIVTAQGKTTSNLIKGTGITAQ